MKRTLKTPAAALFAACLTMPLCPAETDPSARPNVLLITVDDMNWDTPGCYGGKVEGITPNIDRLAAEGMRFEHAHVTVAVCQPCRQTIMTGRYPHRFGALGFSPIDPAITTLPEVLAEAGYINGCLGKTEHLQPTEKFKWSYARGGGELGQGRNPEQYAADVTAFLDLAKKEGKPFFLMANSHDPHRPFHGSGEEKQEFGDKLGKITPPSRTYGPDEIVVPGFLPDLPGVRKELAQYFSSSKRADDTVGAILRALREAGHEKDTLVIFLSDHGMPLATAKWNTYLQSTRTPLIVRWPETVKPDSFDRGHFVSGIDFMPTILDSLGLKAPEGMDGSSFLPLLKGETQSGRDSVITAHYQAIHYYGDKEKRKDILERMVREEGWRYADEWKGLVKDYPIRCIREARYGYIYNQWSDGTNRYFLHYGMAGSAMSKAARTDPKMKERIEMIVHRVPEELYDFQNDPDALHNLIDDPAHRETLVRLRGQLLAWMEQSGDPALPALQEHLKQP